MRVKVSRAADSDLDSILDYSLSHHSREIAEGYLRTIQATFARLETFPALGVARSDLKVGLRLITVGEHAIYYRIDDDCVLIARVLHKAMDPARHF
ncbi:MAG: type II toxin-antitoxin system RelE/ParE family toxin [Pseudomonadota bacterium]|tara:strand:- start:1107 stop:1394 length:288 start_codon:yes stop_codon:yes gene_type:complete